MEASDTHTALAQPRSTSDGNRVTSPPDRSDTPRRDGEASGLGPLGKPKRYWRGLVFSSHGRLADALPPYRSSLNALIARTCPAALQGSHAGGECAWAAHAMMLVEHAQLALQVGRTDLGWKCLHEAQRMEVHGLSKLADAGDDSALRARARSIALEADRKLRGWRKAAVNELLGTPDKPKPNPTVAEITESHLILTESFGNTYIMLRSQRWQVGMLAVAATALVTAWWSFVGPSILATTLPSDGLASIDDALLGTILVFGALGAAISGMIGVVRSPSASIPEQLTAWTGTAARLVVGAVAALVIFLALENVVMGDADVRLIVLQSFVAGFSERLLSSTVEKMSS